MQIQAIQRLETPPLAGVAALRLRSEPVAPVVRVQPVQPFGPGSDQAAVFRFGAQALRLAQQPAAGTGAAEDANESPTLGAADAEPAGEQAVRGGGAAAASVEGAELSQEQRRQVDEFRSRDREVRTHEQSHKAVAGDNAGAIHLEYDVGPDGRRYAVSGDVPIDVSAVSGDPEATVRKMSVVARAASAPANPSGADRQVAAKAAGQASQARAEMAAERYTKAQELLEATQAKQAEAAGKTDAANTPRAEPARRAPLRLVA